MVNRDIFLGSGASLTFVPEVTLYVPIASIASQETITVSTAFADDFRLVKDLYVGCIIEFYDNGTYTSSHRITTNDHNTITFSPAIASSITVDTAADYFHILGYGAPVPTDQQNADASAVLLSDQWLGILESATFPTTEVEMKQLNTSLGGSRNFTLQYKGIETASGANLGLVSNHAAWLYYFFGNCSAITATTVTESLAAGDEFTAQTSNAVYIDDGAFVGTGPIFYRSVGTVICPPILKGQDALADMDKLTLPTEVAGAITNPISYTFTELDSDNLPSFAIEQVISKLPSTDTYRTDTTATAEDLNFVKIARGNRVNTLTLTANENEEVKMTLDLNTRAVHSLEQAEDYVARRGVTDETSFFNYGSAPTFLEPFFFSSGSFKVFGQEFLKINTMTLTMNNNLQDRRFIGVGSKSIKEGIPAQRTYEISFTGHVTDDLLYTELLNQDENNDSGQYIELKFTKDNGEEFELKFTDYYLSANNFPIPDDKGPFVVEGTLMPRSLQSCTVKTHWILQG